MNYPDIISIENCPREEVEDFVKKHCDNVHLCHNSIRNDTKEVVDLFAEKAIVKCPERLFIISIISQIKDDRGFLSAKHQLYFNFDLTPSIEIEESL